jgi:hypothetical protein
MGTRSIIMVTGKGQHAEGFETVRLYRHYDGDPMWNLPSIIAGIERAQSLVFEWNSKSFNFGRQFAIGDVRARVFADCIVAGSISWYSGFDIRVDDEDDNLPGEGLAVFRGPLTLENCGNQGDLEWMYVVDTIQKSVKVYGNGSNPEDLLAGGLTHPSAGADCLVDDAQEPYRTAANAHLDRLLDMGWDVNDLMTGKKKRGRRKAAAK